MVPLSWTGYDLLKIIKWDDCDIQKPTAAVMIDHSKIFRDANLTHKKQQTARKYIYFYKQYRSDKTSLYNNLPPLPLAPSLMSVD
jgi:hypothetical protein